MTDENQLLNFPNINSDLLSEITGVMGLTALSTGKHLLWVEGPTDREIFSLMYPDLEDKFSIIPMGGVEQVKKVDTAFNRLIQELTKGGREVFGIIDRDRNPNLSDEVHNRIHTIPGTCVENLLLDQESILGALKTKKGINHLEENGFESPEDIENLIQDIISGPDFVQSEVRKRFNDEFNPINIDIKDFQNGPMTDFDDFLDQYIQNHKAQMTDIEKIENEVKTIVSTGRWGELDGKRILELISTEFNLSKQELARAVAKEIRYLDKRPAETTEFIREIQKRVDQ